nr:alpha/beta fold hydrolase [uncultured Desulfobacter sp.]
MKYRFFIGVFLFLSISLTMASQAQAFSNEGLSYDKRLSNYSYPFKVENFGFQSQNKSLEMSYMYLFGTGNEQNVVLLHGKNFNGAYWEETARFLSNQGYNVLMPDQIGFGKSSKPKDYQYSFSALARNTKQLMTYLNRSLSLKSIREAKTFF